MQSSLLALGSSFLLVLALACGGGGASTEPDTTNATPPFGEGIRTATATEPNEPGEEGCRTSDECTLTSWVCSPCGSCPHIRMRAVLAASLESARAECRWTGHDGPEPECERCPDLDPSFRDWTAVACVDGRCVAHTLGPTDAEAAGSGP